MILFHDFSRQKLDFSSFIADIYFCYDWTEREGGLKELYQLSARSENQIHALWYIPAVIERRDIFVMEQDEIVRYSIQHNFKLIEYPSDMQFEVLSLGGTRLTGAGVLGNLTTIFCSGLKRPTYKLEQGSTNFEWVQMLGISSIG